MTFQSRIEAYTYVLWVLTKLVSQVPEEDIKRIASLDAAIQEVRGMIEDHVTMTDKMDAVLTDVQALYGSSDDAFSEVKRLKATIKSSDFLQTPQQKFENPLARRLESEIAISLLTAPTEAMMHAVAGVSRRLLSFIEAYPDAVDSKLRFECRELSGPISLGAFKYAPSLEKISTILAENDPAHLSEIMFLHYKFINILVREYPVSDTPARMPVGRLADIAREFYPEDPIDFFRVGLAKPESRGPENLRAHISDTVIYGSDLYHAYPGRGRIGDFRQAKANQLGLMLLTQSSESLGLPRHSSFWAADCRCQDADLTSPYVLDLIESDAVYVAGPSGMTSLFLGQMEILANFENEDDKKHYLAAVVAYIVGGGFHSIHEVIGPAEYALGLVPGYHVVPPRADRRAPAPNYGVFYQQQEQIDPEFHALREVAWERYLEYFNWSYGPRCMPGFVRESSGFIADKISVPVDGDEFEGKVAHQGINPVRGDLLLQYTINTAMVMFERTLAILKHQADANILFKPTYESVGGLYAYLKSEYRSYFSRSCTSADERIFLEECSRAIHNARPILARDPYATSCWSIFHKRRSFAYITQTLDVLAEAFDGRDLERDLTLRH